jgi:hypothetical protein
MWRALLGNGHLDDIRSIIGSYARCCIPSSIPKSNTNFAVITPAMDLMNASLNVLFQHLHLHNFNLYNAAVLI